MVQKMGSKDRKALLIFSIIWVIVCGLFSLCGREFYLPCIICATFVVGFAWLFVPLNSIEVEIERKNALKELERGERIKNRPPRKPIWPIIRKVLIFLVIAIAILAIIALVKSGVSSFIASYGMTPFLLLIIILILWLK